MDRASLARDLEALGSFDLASLQAPQSQNAKSTGRGSPDKSASDVIETVSIGNCSPDESQQLTKAYINSMREDVMGIEDGKSDAIGNRVDAARGKAQDSAEALGEVKV